MGYGLRARVSGWVLEQPPLLAPLSRELEPTLPCHLVGGREAAVEARV